MSDKELTKQRRRALLKAAAAAPAVFTLPSGAALATTSLTCADKSAKLAKDNPPSHIRQQSDRWVRLRVEKVKWKDSNNNNVVGFYLNNVLYKQDGTVSNAQTTTVVANKYYYLLVDYDSYRTGSSVVLSAYPADSSITGPISGGSCWASLTGITPNPGNFF